MLESDESVPDQIGKQTDIFNLLANCFDMVAPDDPEEGKSLTESLLCVFSGLLKSKENQTRVASAPNIITGWDPRIDNRLTDSLNPEIPDSSFINLGDGIATSTTSVESNSDDSVACTK